MIMKHIIKKSNNIYIYRTLGYERVYLPLGKVADTPFHIQGDEYVCLSVCILHGSTHYCAIAPRE